MSHIQVDSIDMNSDLINGAENQNLSNSSRLRGTRGGSNGSSPSSPTIARNASGLGFKGGSPSSVSSLPTPKHSHAGSTHHTPTSSSISTTNSSTISVGNGGGNSSTNTNNNGVKLVPVPSSTSSSITGHGNSILSKPQEPTTLPNPNSHRRNLAPLNTSTNSTGANTTTGAVRTSSSSNIPSRTSSNNSLKPTSPTAQKQPVSPNTAKQQEVSQYITQVKQGEAHTTAEARKLEKEKHKDEEGLYTQAVGAFKVDPAKFAKWSRMQTNYSPFDASLFYPLLTADPTKAKKKLLCLDLDETLVHASTARPAPGKPVHHEFDISPTIHVYVSYRPHLQRFLDEIATLFDLAIFTASQPTYADPLLNAMDSKGYLKSRLYRQHCAEIDGARVKDLSLLGRKLDNVVLLDNSPVAYLFQPRNAIPIVSWFDDENDDELLNILPMLRELAAADTVYDVLDPFNCSGDVFHDDSHQKMIRFVENNSANGKIGSKK